MIDERILAVTGIAVLILIVQGFLHLFLTATGVYLPNRAQPERDSSDDRKVLLEYWNLLRERFHRIFVRSDEIPADETASEGVPHSRPDAQHAPSAPPGEVRARAALVKDRPDPSAFYFRTGMLLRPALVLLLVLSTVFNW